MKEKMINAKTLIAGVIFFSSTIIMAMFFAAGIL